jgi:DHA3 family tetracycline resistance protein-like MFS transporter
VLALVMPERGFRPAPASDRTTFGRMAQQFRAGLRLSRSRPVVRTLMLVSLVGGLASEAFDRLWVVHLLRLDFPFGSGQVLWFAAIGLVGTVLSLLVTVAVNTVFPRALSSRHPVLLMAVLAAVQVASVAVFALAGWFWLAVSMLWLRTIAGVLAEPVTATWMNRNIDSGVRATVLSFESQLNAVGQVAGGPALGAVGNAVSVRAAILASAATLSPVVALYATARRDRRDQC